MSTDPAGQRRALVTGASGFIGRRLCRRLLVEGFQVHGVSRHPRADDAFTWWQVDLADPQATQELIATVRPNTVFHLAGLPSASRDIALVLPTLEQNLLAAVNVMVATASHGDANVILAGSFEEGITAEASANPNSPYAASKQAASAYALMLNALHGLPVVIATIYMVYGPGQEDDKKLIPYLVTSLLDGKAPQLGAGDRPIDWIYVDDVAAALVAICRTQGLEGKRIDVGSGTLVTIRSLAEQVATLVGVDIQPVFDARRSRERETVRKANAARTQELLSWQAPTSLDEGLRTTIDWYRTRPRR